MSSERITLSRTFKSFFDSEKTGAILLIAATIVSLAIANSAAGPGYLGFWHAKIGSLSIEHWINDGLMAIFFLLIGLELERELYDGELSDLKNALLPVIAAGGGIAVPALIHFAFNNGTPTQAGIGIPMATDIAFALGALALLGKRVPPSLKIFLTALAVMDDLGAIVVIAVFYTAKLSLLYLSGALAVFLFLLLLNKFFGVRYLAVYLTGGVIMWLLMQQSGVHATIAGVLLAFAIPFSSKDGDKRSPSHRLENILHKPVAFAVLPLFALANTGVIIGGGSLAGIVSSNGLGIILGLLAGKPVGIALFSFLAVGFGLCRLPPDLTWKHIFGTGILGGIGFTMSIFITNLAFAGQFETINTAKTAILLASLSAGVLGFLWLRLLGKMPNLPGRAE